MIEMEQQQKHCTYFGGLKHILKSDSDLLMPAGDVADDLLMPKLRG